MTIRAVILAGGKGTRLLPYTTAGVGGQNQLPGMEAKYKLGAERGATRRKLALAAPFRHSLALRSLDRFGHVVVGSKRGHR